MKTKQRALVKQLFAEYCSAGTPPNEAAVLAMKKAQEQLGEDLRKPTEQAAQPKDPAQLKMQLRDKVKQVLAAFVPPSAISMDYLSLTVCAQNCCLQR